ncbi:MAG TPA: hypothetical protein VNA25_05210 [Phycisphaerae bacterium]|nr:hypothetical protein [Phycisphaerae bacterium]
MTFILDNNISYKFAKALRALGEDVWGLREKLDPGAPDIEWIPKLGAKGWHFVSGDKHILSRPLERHALRKAGITAFTLGPFFSKRSFRFWDQAVWLIRHWPSFLTFAKGVPHGTCFSVQQNATMRPLSSS